MQYIINNQAIRQTIDTPQNNPWIVVPQGIQATPELLDRKRLQSIQKHFPQQRSPDGNMPVLPYQTLPASFRQLLLESGSSITIRAIEKASALPDLLVDPLHPHSLIGDAESILHAMNSTVSKPCINGLHPTLFCIITLSRLALDNNTAIPTGSIVLIPADAYCSMALANEADDGLHLLLVYYRYSSPIDHGKVQLR